MKQKLKSQEEVKAMSNNKMSSRLRKLNSKGEAATNNHGFKSRDINRGKNIFAKRDAVWHIRIAAMVKGIIGKLH